MLKRTFAKTVQLTASFATLLTSVLFAGQPYLGKSLLNSKMGNACRFSAGTVQS